MRANHSDKIPHVYRDGVRFLLSYDGRLRAYHIPTTLRARQAELLSSSIPLLGEVWRVVYRGNLFEASIFFYKNMGIKNISSFPFFLQLRNNILPLLLRVRFEGSCRIQDSTRKRLSASPHGRALHRQTISQGGSKILQ